MTTDQQQPDLGELARCGLNYTVSNGSILEHKPAAVTWPCGNLSLIGSLRAQLAHTQRQDAETFEASVQRMAKVEAERDEARAEVERQKPVVEAARRSVASARSALGEGVCLDHSICDGCETERRDACDYLDEAIAALGVAQLQPTIRPE